MTPLFPPTRRSAAALGLLLVLMGTACTSTQDDVPTVPNDTTDTTDTTDTDDDLVGRHVHDLSSTTGGDDRARVPGHLELEAGAHQRRIRVEERHRLALHVRAHEGPVGVVVLEERDQRGGH